MAKRSLIDQLNEVVEAILAHPDSALPPVDPSLEPLLPIVAGLRDLPSRQFKERLRNDLQQSRRNRMHTVEKSKELQSVTPYLSIKDAAKAIEFYRKAFGAEELARLEEPDGRVGHAEIRIGKAIIMLADEYPELGFLSPVSIGGSPVKIHLYVEKVDEFFQRALAEGATSARPLKNEFYGDRTGELRDPFGYSWVVSTKMEEVTLDEMKRRYAELTKRDASGAAMPEGYHTITPYLIVNEAAELIDFVKQVFGAEELHRSIGSAGGIHAEVRIGDSMMMIGGGGVWKGTPNPTALHYFVEDVDAVYRRALEAGAKSLAEPSDQDYGERVCGVTDPSGNQWYIARSLEGPYVPEGLRNVNIYFHPQNAGQFIDFLGQAFGSVVVARHDMPDGKIAHAKVRIGDSVIEMGDAHGPYQPMPTTIYMHVENVDASYRRAIEAGAVSISEPADQTYGARSAGVRDPFGNTWYIAAPL